MNTVSAAAKSAALLTAKGNFACYRIEILT
jgi:hypothetical protein